MRHKHGSALCSGQWRPAVSASRPSHSHRHWRWWGYGPVSHTPSVLLEGAEALRLTSVTGCLMPLGPNNGSLRHGIASKSITQTCIKLGIGTAHLLWSCFHSLTSRGDGTALVQLCKWWASFHWFKVTFIWLWTESKLVLCYGSINSFLARFSFFTLQPQSIFFLYTPTTVLTWLSLVFTFSSGIF